MTQKITIIGGSGFVGTNLSKYLIEQKRDVEIIDLRLSKQFPQKTKIADVRDLDTLRQTVTGDIVIHLAAVHRDDIRDNDQYWKTNVYGSKNVAQVCLEKNIEKLIFTSSVAVYGSVKTRVEETALPNPDNEYGRTKLEAEKILMEWQRHKNNSLIIVRPTVIFGEGNRGNVFNLLNQIIRKRFMMVGKGNNIKSMAYIDNVVSFLTYCIDVEHRSKLFNYVDTPNLTMNELVSFVNKISNHGTRVDLTIPYWLGLSIGYIADITSWLSKTRFPISSVRVKKFASSSEFTSCELPKTEFDPKVSLIEGLERTIQREFLQADPKREIFYTE